MSEHETSEQEIRPDLPPATFEFLVASLRFQAEIAMGAIRISEEETEPDIDAARHFIDLLIMLQEKTKGNLSLEEGRLIENSLTELRFRFVQAAGEASKSRIITP